MTSFDPDYEFKDNQHFKTRAQGVLFVKPAGYDNKVMKVTINEIGFDNSLDANRFVDYMTRRYANRDDLIKCRRLKMISQYDQ